MSELEITTLINEHARSGILLDANLLLVYLVGQHDPDLIERFKRTRTFTKGDYRLLVGFLARFTRIVTTPGVLAEVNSLSNQLQERNKPQFLALFRSQIEVLEERHRPSKEVCRHAYFDKCGLTDAAIMTIAQDGLLVLRLKGVLDRLGIPSINFNHIRFLLGPN